MKVLYFECNMGAAGDMLTAALAELTGDVEAAVKKLNALGVPGVVFTAEKTQKCGITGTHIKVSINGYEEDEQHAYAHNTLESIEKIVSALNASDKVKSDVLNVYRLIAEAESSVHGESAEHIHFHEVGTLDAIADVAAVCLLLEELAPDRICSSPINTGRGSVKCAHGILPVPAPATAQLLMGIPAYSNEIEGELCTPTGAALLRYFAESFGAMPTVKTETIGLGMGKKDFEQANCVRAFFGEGEDWNGAEYVCELSCNIDDMTGEEIGFALNALLKGGALEAYTVPAGMKKSRPAYLFKVLCKPEERDGMLKLIFKYTSTLGIRESTLKRYTLERTVKTYQTPYGEVRVKYSEGYGVKKEKIEYDDLARISQSDSLANSSIRPVPPCGRPSCPSGS